ncbi:hypothetical protein E4U41_003542 [Claviceps citrina]|nr:hypothetical protein E4U41_003542 [Claviceps citrina]
MEQTGEKQLQGTWSYGRFFSSERPRKYLSPIDEEALDAQDVTHKFFLELRRGALFRAPVTFSQHQPRRVMDLGTGTGIWCIDIAALAYQTNCRVEIMAVDINMIQPERIPGEIVVHQLDLESPSWGNSLMDDCDLIHMRLLAGSITPSRWPSIYRKVYEHLKPGSGCFEHTELDWTARWDGPPPEGSALNEWSRLLQRGWINFNRNGTIDGARVRRTLAEAGFIGIREETIRCYLKPTPSSTADPSEKWLNAVLRVVADSMALLPLIEGLNYTKDQVEELCNGVKRELHRNNIRAYFVL